MPPDISKAPETVSEAPSLHDPLDSIPAEAGELQRAPEQLTDMHADVSEQPETMDEAPSLDDRLDSIDEDRWDDIGGM